MNKSASALQTGPSQAEPVVSALRASVPSALNIAQRISAAMADVDYVQKEKKSGMNYSIVSHDAVTAKVRPILHKHGVVYYPRNMTIEQVGNRTQAVFDVRFENIDDRTDFIDVATFGYGVDPQDKGPGKAMSYGVKYALLKVLGLETGDDPDTVQDERANFKAVDAGQSEGTVSQRPPANDTTTIDQEQFGILQALIETSGADIQGVCKAYKITALNKLQASDFDRLRRQLDKKLEAKNGTKN